MTHKQSAKSFCATYLPMLTDKQYQRTIEALERLLEYTYTQGVKAVVKESSHDPL